LQFRAHAGAGRSQSLFEIRNALVDYFTPQNYVPVLVNRGYTVGDVVEVDGVNFYARALRCFPRLKPPDPVQTALTDVLESSSAGVSFGLRLRQIFDSSAGADLVNRIRITFSDVTVVSVARLDLRDALDRQACPEIAPLVDATVTAVDRNRKVCLGSMGRQILARELDSGPAGHRATSRISRRGDDDSLCDPIKDVADALERGRSVVERGEPRWRTTALSTNSARSVAIARATGSDCLRSYRR